MDKITDNLNDGLRANSLTTQNNIKKHIKNLKDKIDVSYEVINKAVESFDAIVSNEIETANALTAEREVVDFDGNFESQKIYYVTDLHLMHRLNDANCKCFDDVVCVLQKIVDSLLSFVRAYEKNIILIGGDTSASFAYFEEFVKILRASIDERGLGVKVIFTLGNHELWDFDGVKFKKIVDKYRRVISKNKMYLLQNNLIFKYGWNDIEEISTEELKNISKSELTARLKKARLILFGGLGFAGYNEVFNANQLIYRFAVNRQQEIEESKKLEELYKKICAVLSDKKVIIFTHMPLKDWCSDSTQIKGFVYVSGHNHRNYFYDDGDYRVYSDNQIGYNGNKCYLKYFYMEDDYDVFATYGNGIYEITRDEYIDFNLGKNMQIAFTRVFDKLYMLKKNGYYMFILQNEKGNLYILHGGAIKRLAHNEVDYYYENMDKVISFIKTPLDKFSNYQKQIADKIKEIGGWGSIHGAIIDIDWDNHIYVNPIDYSITAYWASDIIYKRVFENVPALLQSNRPDIYANYLKQIEGKSEEKLAINKSMIDIPVQVYLETVIYRASREIKKMQRLYSNILTTWTEPEVKKLSDNNK